MATSHTRSETNRSQLRTQRAQGWQMLVTREHWVLPGAEDCWVLGTGGLLGGKHNGYCSEPLIKWSLITAAKAT